MATPQTRHAIVQAILKRRGHEQIQKEKKSMKGYIPSYLEGDEKCVVCGDKATGYHYKCITCEGCKGFFRRTVQKGLEGTYQCKHASRCDINKVTRNQCQLCRYNKCIAAGMAKDLVLDEEKRLAKRRLIEQNREVRRHKELSQMMAQCGWRIERPTDDERRIIHEVTQAYFQANDVQNRTLDEVQEDQPVSERFSVALTSAITNVVDFAKRIPLFANQISAEDQVKILKGCCMEVIALRCVTSYNHATNSVHLFPSVDVTKDQLRLTRLEPFSDSLFTLAQQMGSLDLSPVELAMLQAVVIFTGDRPEISDVSRLERAQDVMIKGFEHHLNEVWPHDPQFWPRLLMKLTEVRTVSACLSGTLMTMRMDDPEELGRLFMRRHIADTNSAGGSQQRPQNSHALGNKAVFPSLALTSPYAEFSCRLPAERVGSNQPRPTYSGLSLPKTCGTDYSHPIANRLRLEAKTAEHYKIWCQNLLGNTNGTNQLRDTSLKRDGALQPTCEMSTYATDVTRDTNTNGNKEQSRVLTTNKYDGGTNGFSFNGRFPSLRHSQNLYETFRNSQNKLFEKVVKPQNGVHKLTAEPYPPRGQDDILLGVGKSVHRPTSIPGEQTLGALSEARVRETFALQSAVCSSNRQEISSHLIAQSTKFYNEQLNALRQPLSLGLPHIYPRNLPSDLAFRRHFPANDEASTKRPYSAQQTVPSVTLNQPDEQSKTTNNNAMLTADILRMGLPMLLPFVSGASGGRISGSSTFPRSQQLHVTESQNNYSQVKITHEELNQQTNTSSGTGKKPPEHHQREQQAPVTHDKLAPKISFAAKCKLTPEIHLNCNGQESADQETATSKNKDSKSHDYMRKRMHPLKRSGSLPHLAPPRDTFVQTKRLNSSPLPPISKHRCVSPNCIVKSDDGNSTWRCRSELKKDKIPNDGFEIGGRNAVKSAENGHNSHETMVNEQTVCRIAFGGRDIATTSNHDKLVSASITEAGD